jgi:hypothetical protein
MECIYCGKIHDPTIVIKAVALENLWIWHGFFRLPETLNNINVLQRSLLFARLAAGDAPTYSNKIREDTPCIIFPLLFAQLDKFNLG